MLRTRTRPQIYLLGNPAVVWTGLCLVIGSTLAILLSTRYRYRHRLTTVAIFLLAGWLTNLMPYILVERATWLYHYIPSLYFAQLLFAVAFDVAVGIVDTWAEGGEGKQGGKRLPLVERPCEPCEGGAIFRRKVRMTMMLLIPTAWIAWNYVYFSPWSYSIPLTSEQHKRRQWLTSWVPT